MTVSRCARCGAEDIAVDHRHAAWEIRRCRRCSFSWRTSEPVELLDAALRPEPLQLVDGAIEGLRDAVLPRGGADR